MGRCCILRGHVISVDECMKECGILRDGARVLLLETCRVFGVLAEPVCSRKRKTRDLGRWAVVWVLSGTRECRRPSRGWAGGGMCVGLVGWGSLVPCRVKGSLGEEVGKGRGNDKI